jgi:hypothetical protein
MELSVRLCTPGRQPHSLSGRYEEQKDALLLPGFKPEITSQQSVAILTELLQLSFTTVITFSITAAEGRYKFAARHLFLKRVFKGQEAETVLCLKNAVFWDVAPYVFITNRRFGGTRRFHLQDSGLLTLFLARVIPCTLKMRATDFTSVYNKTTRRHITENGIHHSHRHDNLNPTNSFFDLVAGERDCRITYVSPAKPI